MTGDVASLIIEIVREMNEQRPPRSPQELDDRTPLFGRDGILDSMGLVTLVVAVEQAIEDRFGVSVSLADEKAMSQAASPYRTIGALAEYASRSIPGRG